MGHPKGSQSRGEAFQAAAGQQHRLGSGWLRFSAGTQRDRVQAEEGGGPAALMPASYRSDKGKLRVRTTRQWQDGCDLPEGVQVRIAKQMEGIARGLLLKGRNARETRRLAATEHQRLSVEVGVTFPRADLAALCKLTDAWVSRSGEMKSVRDFAADHKRYSDNHEFRVRLTLTLTRTPMEVLMGDVHRGDMTIADAIATRKGRLKGAFGVLERRHVSALPGYLAGDRMNSPTKSKGKPVDPCPHGPERLLPDILIVVTQFNGTPQDGQLGGLSSKGMLGARIAATGWTVQVPDEATFDLAFSKEVRRDVHKGSITIDNRPNYGPVLTDLNGARQVPFLIPLRDPEGPIICFRNNVIHRLHEETFALNDRDGAWHKGTITRLQKAEIYRCVATADGTVHVQQFLSASGDMGPVACNPPDAWTFGTIDKAGVLGRSDHRRRGESG